MIEEAGLTWSVVESIPVHNSIKIGAPERERYAGWYKDSDPRAGQGRDRQRSATTSCRWSTGPAPTSTYRLPTTGYALRFDAIDFAAYDLFVLEAQERRGRATAPARIAEAEARLKALSAGADRPGSSAT